MITIVGAGPVGCYAASLLADKFNVLVIEEHKSVGLPVQCTGIVTQEIFNFVPRKNDFLVNEVNNVRIFPPNNKHLNLRLEKPDIILDRQKFDNYFYNLARKKGVKFLFNHKFIGRAETQILVKNLSSGKVKKLKCSYLIGADGPFSPVAKSSGLYTKRKFFLGVQAVVKKNNNNTVDFYPFKHGFGWAVPENNSTLRVGVAVTTHPKDYFAHIIKKYPGRIVSKQGGFIPIFNPVSKFSRKNTFLIGDAAGFVKATTGGGIIPGLRSAEILAKSIKNNASYELGVYHHLFPSLLLNLKMRRVMDVMKESEWNELVKELSHSRARTSLENINRDDLLKLTLSLIMKKPGLLKYGFKHLISLF